MRELVFAEGGRPLYNDDLESLQDDFFYFSSALFQNMEAHVVTNVSVTSRGGGLYDVSYGIVWLAGQLRRFNGASGISLPAEIVLGDMVVLDERAYQTGGTKPAIQEHTTVVRAATDEQVSKIRITAEGVLRYEKANEARFRTIGDVQPTASINAAHYDATGRGKYGTPAHGWGLCDGREGRADLQSRFIVGHHPEHADYDTIGKTGGFSSVELTAAQMPSHFHGLGTGVARSGSTVTYSGGSSPAKAVNDATGNLKNTEYAGSSQAHENRPPFYVLAYRQWIGF